MYQILNPKFLLLLYIVYTMHLTIYNGAALTYSKTHHLKYK